MSWTRTTLVAAVGLAAIILISPSALHAQGQGGGIGRGFGGGGFGGGGFGGGGGPVALLQRTDVQEELELLDDQKEQIKALSEKSRERMGELFRRGGGAGNAAGGAGAGGADRIEEMRETFRKFGEEMQAEVDKILLPHQTKRLKQLDVQFRMRGGGIMALGSQVSEQIGISEDQMDKLRDKARGLEEELRKKTAELRKQMQDQLLAELTDDQRKQMNEMIGEPFEFRDEQPQVGGGGGNIRGRATGAENRGGDRRRRPTEEK